MATLEAFSYKNLSEERIGLATPIVKAIPEQAATVNLIDGGR